MKLKELLVQALLGYVFEAYDNTNQRTVALKRIQKVGKKLSREYEILLDIKDCDYVVKMLDLYYSKTEDNKLIQNIVFEYMESNLEDFISKHNKNKKQIPEKTIQEYAYQILKGLEYIHSKGIAHRDLKPDNVLINDNGIVKICDFGGSKYIDERGKNTPYIVSRYYRAPELILCITKYTQKIDMWSFGCILGELATSIPIFQGKTEGDQLFAIFKILGSPSKEEFDKIAERVPYDKKIFQEFQTYEKQDISLNFQHLKESEQFLDLLKKCLQYLPENRISASEALKHPFFEGLEEKYP
ncbi:protein kinase domain protein [Ichthyophthirius multifiliis]|uniref:Protein kinase domain protein n=1 Tax=Ichthyophthirius multifiliis TaxID=5932 RepID=G0QSW0_ICHMU|nr:protein kinase domain protein [Ichthyophthirius multifiliis]EGR31693.1 protein kinase domain protein [Ichthyophthirius multifiliis]|eukprot:XP_004035179.1 protein kinase domain protein [Ichthyophthirius multifiliis]